MTFPFSGTRLEFPRLDADGGVRGYTDMYVRPVELGWHVKWADFLAGYGFYAPSGNFELGAPDNTGLGMWSHEALGGATVYMDKGRKWHVSATTFYEVHSKKKNLETKVGNLLTVEGGIGRSLFDGYGNIGAAYYGQWKVTDDQTPNLPNLFPRGRNRVQGIGPEIGVPIPAGKTVLLLKFRYFREFSVRSNTQGQTMHFSVTIPLAQFQ